MSVFNTVEVACPSCTSAVSFDLVHSVNATRGANLRAAILDGTFQQKPCPTCGHTFRTEPEFAYIDTRRGLWIAVWPTSELAKWPEYEKRTRESFARAFGDLAPPAARAIGNDLRPRAVFGWPALSEKILADEAGIDDRTLELAKAALIRTMDVSPILKAVELRLIEVEGDTLTFGWIRTGSEDLEESLTVPKALIGEIEAAGADWAELRKQIDAGPFVDLGRLTLATA